MSRVPVAGNFCGSSFESIQSSFFKFAISVLVIVLTGIYSVFLVYGAPEITYNTPTLSDNATSTYNWVYVSFNSSEPLNQSLLEWGNASWSYYTNITMLNATSDNKNWYVNITGLFEGSYNYTIWALNTTDSTWNPSVMKFVTVDISAPYNISACQNLTRENGSYILVRNVSSTGTCFNILANNITIDGAGYTINYSRTATGYAINNSFGYNSTTIKNINIVQGSASSDAYAIYLSGMVGGSITNITISTSGQYGYGIHLDASNGSVFSNNTVTISGDYAMDVRMDSSSANTFTNNTFTLLGSNTYNVFVYDSTSNRFDNNNITSSGGTDNGITLSSSNSNNFTNNNITVLGASSQGVYILNSNSNTLTSNLILATNTGSAGVYLDSSDTNNINGGSITSNQYRDYLLLSTNATNTFVNTNFTSLRKLYFGDNTSYFNYNNQTNGTMRLKTNIYNSTVGIFSGASINRTLLIWSNITMQWNDTNSTVGITANYTLTGLLPDTTYYIYNTSGVVQTKSYNLTTNSVGELPSFNISLNGSTAILVDSVPNITVNSPSNGSYYNATTIAALVLNITTNEPAEWCGFSLNGTANKTMGNTSQTAWNYSNSSLGISEGLNNITFYCNDSRGNIGNSSTIYFTKDTTTPTITIEPTCDTKTSSSMRIVWNVSDITNNYVSYRISGSSDAWATSSQGSTATPAITLSGLTSSTTYAYTIRSCDLALNCDDATGYTCSTASSGTTNDDDSGGTTGGGTTGGDSSSGLSKSWSSITAGSTAVMTLTSTSVDVTDIIFKATQALSKAKITVSKYSTKPSATTSTPPGSVYQYVSITPENITDAKITATTISFRVNSSWISSNLINASTIVLYRYAGGQWNALVTHPTGTSGIYTTYLAETPGFSYFAITGKLKGASTPAAPPAPTPAKTNQTENSTTANNTSITLSTISSNTTSQNNGTISGGDASLSTKSYLIAAIVIIIAAVALMAFREKLKIKVPEKLKVNIPKFYAGNKTQTPEHKYTFNPSEVKKAELVYKPQPKEEKVKYKYEPKK